MICRIAKAIASVTPNKLTDVWKELDVRLNVWRIIKVVHIEHFKDELA